MFLTGASSAFSSSALSSSSFNQAHLFSNNVEGFSSGKREILYHYVIRTMVGQEISSESDDFPYEEKVLREPLKLQAWRRYLAAIAGAPPQKRFSIYERALRALPGSYKLWRGYLAELLDAARPLPISDPSYAALNGAFERALATMHRMPRIWLMYLASLTAQRRVTRARRTFDRALHSLPVSQHARVWPLYLRLVSLPGVPSRPPSASTAATSYPSESDDFPYEEKVLREPLKLQVWRRYLAALAGAPPQKRFSIYERALRALPESYKLWRGYLAELLDAARPSPSPTPPTPRSTAPSSAPSPRCTGCPASGSCTSPPSPRSAASPARAAPSTAPSAPSPSPSTPASGPLPPPRLPPRRPPRDRRPPPPPLPRDPSHLEDFIELLLRSSRWQEAVPRLAAALNDDDKPFCSVKGKTRRQLWLDLCDIVASHAAEISTTGLNKGLLWTSLADYYARRGLFAKARDVFEDGLNAVSTARDFGLIFEAYAQFEQLLLAAKLDASDGEVDNGNLNDGEFWLNGGDDTDFLIARIELLFDRRPKLLNCVLLRQNPHNVEQWRRRVTLFDGDPSTQVSTYVQALKTVDPMKAVGKLYTLWVDFARMYESRNLLDSAEEVFERATQVNFKSVDHLATVWCEWAEMELRHNNFEKALQLMRQATAEPSVEVKKRAAADGNEPVQMKLHKSLRLWSAYVDLEESLGSVESTRDVYDRILDLKIATPQIILNYASFLEEHKYFEDEFKIYERGVKLFKYPHVREIWAMYLTKFVKRYGNTKLDRARDLFECAIEQTPSQEVKPLYFQYAKMEEDYGLLRRALHVYERAVKAVPDCEKSSIYESYINRTESLGFKEVRKIYEQAIEAGLPDSDLKTLCMRLADREASLGEIDRARRLYTYASEYADLQSDSNFWKKWREFEIMHGNDDTFREMLRIKRTVSLPAQTFVRIKRQRLQ
uniref:Pre-mRNA-splicing factor SYF1 n=1 Tax=Ananas comosus var. bracteatus TaxID=296719 RepID=A0A6V7PA88_ANACO|nr:unnamed protein product [Ananas comosus var. bracteatus]